MLVKETGNKMIIKKKVKKSGNSGYLYLPAEWYDKEVLIMEIEGV